jgi:hypothetical protein
VKSRSLIHAAAIIALGFAAALGASLSHAQTTPTLTFTAQTTTGAGSVVPALTWSTTPAATSCTASGAPDWTGTKAASGTQNLTAITSSRTYTLACTWPGDTSARLTWVAPTQNTDGTALAKCASQTATGACLRSFTIHHGASATVLSDTRAVDDRNATTYTWTGLTAGTHFFGIRALNGDGGQSELSNVVSKVIASTQTVNRQVAITVNPAPNPPTALTVE